MPFPFPLASVLRYRESLEQREYFALEKLQLEIAQVETRVRQVEEDYLAASQNREAKLAQGIPAAEVQFAYEYQRALEQQSEAFRAQLQELKMKWRRQLECFHLARRNRETLEKLREEQLNTYLRERAKREQAVIDDIFLSRRRRGN